MGAKAMAKGMNPAAFVKASLAPSEPEGLHRHPRRDGGVFRFVTVEQVGRGAILAKIEPELLKQGGREKRVAVFLAFTAAHVDQHAFAIDVANLEVGKLADP